MSPCVCGYGKTQNEISNMSRHKKTCSVLNSTLHKLTYENTRLKKQHSNNGDWEIKYKMLEEKHQALIKLIKKNPPTRPAMTQPRRLKIASNQDWKCNVCTKKLSSVFHVDHIARWTDTFDDSDENLQVLCVECHTYKTSQERHE
jgi:hypothetical protein